MNLHSKLKPEKSLVGFIPAAVILIGFFMLWFFWGKQTAYGFMAFAIFAAGFLLLITYVRILNVGFLTNALFLLFAGIMLTGIGGAPFELESGWAGILGAGNLFFMILTLYLVLSRKYKWRGREVLELTAAPVEGTRDGFTARPHPIGKAEYSGQQLMDFTKFLRRNMIALPYVEDDRVFYAPITMAQSFCHLYGWNHDLSGKTWVSFDLGGNVAANIAHKEYLSYHEDLTFDQLCDSLGSLFIEFMEMFKKGDGIRIINRMNALKENPFT